MSQMTVHLNDDEQAGLDEVKKLFGTFSNGAAARAAIQLALIIARASPNGSIIVRNQVKDENMVILLHR